MKNKVSEVIARPVRGLGQGGVGWVATEFIDSWVFDMDDRQYGILVVVIGGLVSFVQNYLEERTGKAILRRVPEPDVPVVDEGGNHRGPA